jgi:hypothetical protein
MIDKKHQVTDISIHVDGVRFQLITQKREITPQGMRKLLHQI